MLSTTVKGVCVGAILLGGLGACAPKSKDIPASYISPTTYQNYSCARINEERNRATGELNAFIVAQDKKAGTDTASVVVGVIFWPALIGLAAGSDQEGRIGQLKGEYDALTSAGIQKNCFK